MNLPGPSQCHLLPGCGVECTLDKGGTLLVEPQGSQGLKCKPTRLYTQTWVGWGVTSYIAGRQQVWESVHL